MNTPQYFYQEQKESNLQKLAEIKRKLLLSSVLRLLVFLVICFTIYYLYGSVNIMLPLVFAEIGLFLFLISRHTNLKKGSDKIKELIKLNEKEIHILETRDFSVNSDGVQFEDGQHAFSEDIDLFGKGSFFQYLNRTVLKEGAQQLADIFKSNNIEGIQSRQEAIKELAGKPVWRQEFSAVASLVETDTASYTIINWLASYKKFVPGFIKWLPLVFSLLSVGFIAAYALAFIKGMHLLMWFLTGVVITAVYLSKINILSRNVSKVQDTFYQYHQLLALLEKEDFSSDLLKNHKKAIRTETKKASLIFKEFSKAIDALDQRNNMLFGVLANGFLLWDLKQAYRLENWIMAYRAHISKWFEVIALTDAYNSLSNFAFNHPNYVYPEIKNFGSGIVATKLAHPLLNPDKRIANDFYINNEEFFIITGANMAGKSTFLRTVSLQIVMSNIGLPVCAEACSYSPIKLITSMRTSDSLSDDESYFFSELKRLKFIVDEIKTDKYFIILDEILKGTNSTDKASGSKKFLRKLVKSQSTGIIATHDLSLCDISEELPQVKNHYFDAEIVSNELFFDYKFKDGICHNMNASFLLRKMEIVDD